MQMEISRMYQQNPNFDARLHHFQYEYHRAMAFAEMRDTEQALQAIRNAEALYQPQWNRRFSALLDEMYAEYYLAARNYEKSMEYFLRYSQYIEELGATAGPYLAFISNRLAQAYLEKGDYKNAAEKFREIIKIITERNSKQFYEQINEFRTFFELDKAEMEAERRLAAIERMRIIITALAALSLALAAIVAVAVWSRRKIAEKNRGLYRKIKEQDKLNEEISLYKSLEKAPQQCDNEQQRELVAKMKKLLLEKENFINHDDTIINQLIDALCTNRSYLFESVKKVTGKTALNYINLIRLEKAKKLLETTDKQIETIAEMSGFNSVRTFNRQFRDQFDISPTQYRKIEKSEKVDENI